MGLDKDKSRAAHKTRSDAVVDFQHAKEDRDRCRENIKQALNNGVSKGKGGNKNSGSLHTLPVGQQQQIQINTSQTSLQPSSDMSASNDSLSSMGASVALSPKGGRQPQQPQQEEEGQKKVLSIVMRGPNNNNGTEAVASSPTIVKIVFNSKTSYEALEKLTRIRCRLKNRDEFYLIDKEGLACALDGSLPSGVYYLKIQTESESSDGEDDARMDKGSGDSTLLPRERSRSLGYSKSNEPAVGRGAESVTSYINDKKVHVFRGHNFYAKHFHRIETCHQCKQPLFGMGKQGYCCKECGTIVHKKCYLNFPNSCSEVPRKGEGLKCKKCRYRYIDSQNHVTACHFHDNLTEKHGWCRTCNEPYTAIGCCKGWHQPKKKYKEKANSSAEYLEQDLSVNEKEALEGSLVNTIKCDCTSHFERQFFNNTVPFSAKELFDMFHGSDCPELLAFSESMGYENFNLEDWKPLKKGSTTSGESVEGDLKDEMMSTTHFERTISYDMPFQNPMSGSIKMVRTTEEHTLRWVEKDLCYVFELTATCPDVPYGDTFKTTTRYCVYSTLEGYSHISSCAQPFFVKKTMMKPFITKGCYGGVENYSSKFMAYMKQIAKRPWKPVVYGKATEEVESLADFAEGELQSPLQDDPSRHSTNALSLIMQILSLLVSPFVFLFKVILGGFTSAASFTEGWEQPSHMTISLGFIVVLMFMLSCIVYIRILQLEESIRELALTQ